MKTQIVQLRSCPPAHHAISHAPLTPPLPSRGGGVRGITTTNMNYDDTETGILYLQESNLYKRDVSRQRFWLYVRKCIKRGLDDPRSFNLISIMAAVSIIQLTAAAYA